MTYNGELVFSARNFWARFFKQNSVPGTGKVWPKLPSLFANDVKICFII
jgi:hypothetical protein